MTVRVGPVELCEATPAWKWPSRALLVADTRNELLLFAWRIGLDERWLREEPVPHFALTGEKRAGAVRCGAVETDADGIAGVVAAWNARRAMAAATPPLFRGGGGPA